jgi:hypothetical protein
VSVSCSPHLYANPPKESTVITVTYLGYFTNGKLRNPLFLRERLDLTWNDVLSNYNANKQ